MKAIAFTSKKAKGTRLEKKLARLIREKGLDDSASRMLLSGSVWNFRGDIFTKLAYHFECKNSEKHKIWEEWYQAESQSPIGKTPILVISGNFRPILAIMQIDDFLNLVKEVKDYEDKNTQ